MDLDQDRHRIAETLKQRIGYVLKDCDEAGFTVASAHLRVAMDELARASTPMPALADEERQKG